MKKQLSQASDGGKLKQKDTSMSKLKIITNNHPRNLLDWHELTPKEKKEFDWLDESGDNGLAFFRYRGQAYALDEVIRLDTGTQLRNLGWHGYIGETFFSSVVVRLSDDGETVIVGLALS